MERTEKAIRHGVTQAQRRRMPCRPGLVFGSRFDRRPARTCSRSRR